MSLRDSQRTKFYKWEREVVSGRARDQRLSLEACGELISKVCRSYSVAIPEVKDGRGTRKASAQLNRINLPRWARTKGVVLHELTHCILDFDAFRRGRWGNAYAAHGPEFMRLFIQLLANEGIGRAGELGKSARAYGLKITGPTAVPARISWRAQLKEELEDLVGRTARRYNLSRADVYAAIRDMPRSPKG